MDHQEPTLPLRAWLLLLVLVLAVGLVFGTLGTLVWARSALAASNAPAPANPASRAAGLAALGSTVELRPAEQDDYIILVAEAYDGDGDLALARDRLKRLGDPAPVKRVQDLAVAYSSQKDLIAMNLAALAVALGSRDAGLLSLTQAQAEQRAAASASATPMQVSLAQAAPGLSAPLPATDPAAVAPAPALPPPPTWTRTPLPARTFTPPPRPPTLTPRPANTARPPAPPVAPPAQPASNPPPVTEFYPPLGQIRNLSYQPASVAPGQTYWHLTKVVYCDVNEKRFGCPDMPGGEAGTSIYVMSNGADIDAFKGGANLGDHPDVIGAKKALNDMCNCTFAFLVSDYKIQVRGMPSDSLAGFCLCTSNGSPIPDGHAHVRYFLYFTQVRR